jgi:hypothetical protein
MSDDHSGPQPNHGSDREQQRPAETEIPHTQSESAYSRYRQKTGDLLRRIRDAIRYRSQDATRTLALSTWFLAICTWALAVIGYWALDESRRALETTQRAWVGPQNLHIDGALAVDRPLNLIVDYHNTGRQPALDFFYQIDPKIFTLAESESDDMARASIAYTEKCRSALPLKGYSVIYPTSGFSTYNLSFEIEKELIDWSIIYGTNIIVVSGCFAYNTASDAHRSSFCYFFQNGRTRPTAWAVCRKGNYAD